MMRLFTALSQMKLTWDYRRLNIYNDVGMIYCRLEPDMRIAGLTSVHFNSVATALGMLRMEIL